MFGRVLTLFSILLVIVHVSRPRKYNFDDPAVSRYEVERDDEITVRSQSLGDWNIIKVQLLMDTGCERQKTDEPSVSFCYRNLRSNGLEGLQKTKEELAKAEKVSCEEGLFVHNAPNPKLRYEGWIKVKSVDKQYTDFRFNFTKQGNVATKRSVVFTLNFLNSDFELRGKPASIPFVLRRMENATEVFDFVLFKSLEFVNCEVEMRMLNVDPFGYPEHSDDMFNDTLNSMQLDEIGISEDIDGMIEQVGVALNFNETLDISAYMASAENIVFWTIMVPTIIMTLSVTLTCVFGCLYFYCPKKVYKQGPQVTKIVYKVAEQQPESVPTAPKKTLIAKPKPKKKEALSEPEVKAKEPTPDSPFVNEAPKKKKKMEETAQPTQTDPAQDSRPTDKIEDSTLPATAKTEGQVRNSAEPTTKTEATTLDAFKELTETTEVFTANNDKLSKGDSSVQNITLNDEKEDQSKHNGTTPSPHSDPPIPLKGSSDSNVVGASKTGTGTNESVEKQ